MSNWRFVSIFFLLPLLVSSCDQAQTRYVSESNLSVAPNIAPQVDSTYPKLPVLSLPLQLPISEMGEELEDGQPRAVSFIRLPIDGDRLASLLNDSVEHFAFSDEKDVPTLEESLISNNAYALGSTYLHRNYRALLLSCAGDMANYYYLYTFSPNGQPIEGMCIAFEEGDLSDNVNRKVSLRSDGFHIVQDLEVDGKRGDHLSAWYTISEDGKFKKIVALVQQ